MNIDELYLCPVNENNITYSVDMLRLKTFLTYQEFSEIEFRFRVAYSRYVKKYYSSSKISSFFYNYLIEVDEGKTFWFGFLHNSEKRKLDDFSKYNFTIEFNPNKIKDNDILMYLLRFSKEWYIVSYDLAFDLKVNVLDIIFDPYKKREVKIFSSGFDDKTIYFGSGDGRTKIYNKKNESSLNINYNLTRVEVSRICDNFPINNIGLYRFGDCIPKIYLNNYLYSFSDYKDKTLFAVLYAVQNNFPLKDLSRQYKKKITNLLEGGCKVLLSEKCATQAIRNTIFHYFIKDFSIRWK